MVKHCEVFPSSDKAFKSTAGKGKCKVGRIHGFWYVVWG